MRYLLKMLAVVFASPLGAQEVQSCDQTFLMAGAVAPGDMKGKAYANGTVRFAVVHDGRDNATDAMFLTIFSPDPDDASRRQCHLIGREEGVGYAHIGLDRSVADYQPATGLTVQVPARIFLPDAGFTNATLLSINVNQATNEVSVTQELGNE